MATGAIQKVDVESGSNANGSYVKFPDGTLMCWKTVKQSNIAINSAWGSAYESTTQASFGSWPVPFIEKPMVECTMQQESGTVTAFPQQISGVTTTSAGTTYAWSPRSQTSATIIFGILGIGRWKA